LENREIAVTTLFLGGDVMTGRGVDQILPHPGDPRLRETYVRDARTYIELAEKVNGPIPRPVDFSWPWGDALTVLDEFAPDVRVFNLETSVTRGGAAARGKAVHYRMSPDNLGCLVSARPDVCVLANNHVLDFGDEGLAATLDALASAGIPTAGAGRTARDAARPAVITADARRVVVFSLGSPSSGIPPGWAATEDGPGVCLLPDLSAATAGKVLARVRQVKRQGDVVVASIHWGSNWGYQIPPEQVRFAHRLVDGGVDVVHGHSSHHPRAIELWHGKVILYGCGDLVDDYEGIRGYEEYRDDLRLLYFVSVAESGDVSGLRMVPMQARRMRLEHASNDDAHYLSSALDRAGRAFGTRVVHTDDGILRVLVGE
jgi:poly-gamma-glutamate capsule biosynthesis protein CapA/YwtB (metallophosphatase superfamily)